jgi:hypothetical protein
MRLDAASDEQLGGYVPYVYGSNSPLGRIDINGLEDEPVMPENAEETAVWAELFLRDVTALAAH